MKLNKELEIAAGKLELSEIKALIEKGADAKAINYSGAHGWYSGNSSQALFCAVKAF